MDKQLLSALNNVSVALERLADMLSKKDNKSSATTTALQSNKLDKQLVSIDKGVKQLQSDTKMILKNQEILIKLSKQKPMDKDPIARAADPKQKTNLKDGLKSIMMIAVGVLAIGLAFKLVGGIKFASVIALAIALPLVAIAFEKIAKLKDLKGSQMKNLVLVTVAIATAITLSSFILSMVKPVGIFKLFTAIMIGAMFAAVSLGIGKFLIGLKKADINPMRDWKMLIFLPVVMLAISVAIAASSFALQLVKPVGIFKLFTAILIAAMFGALSFGLGKLIQAFRKTGSIADLAKMAIALPIILVAISISIAASSFFLSKVKPIGLFQFFTALFIAIIFIPISFAIPFLAKAMRGVDLKRIVLLPIMIIALAASIWISSLFFSKTKVIPFGKLVNILAQAVTLAAVSIVLSFAIKVLSKIPIGQIIKGSLAMIIIAGVIMVTSLILSVGKYDKYPKPDWAIGVGLSLAFFGVGAVLLGTQALNPFFYAGLGIIALVAGTVVAVSYILAAGNYEKYPSAKWVGSTVAILGGFGVLLVALAIVSPLLLVGGLALFGISKLIKSIDKTFSEGNFTKYPSQDWIKGVSMSIKGFTKIMTDTSFGDVLKGGLKSFFGGGVDDVAKAILKIDKIFSKGNFQVFPSTNWMMGLSNSVKQYVELAKYLSASGVTSAGGLLGVIFGFKSLADGYEQLAKGVGKLGEELNKVDTEKLMALKNLTGSIVLLSLMDVDQFEAMMDALEDKAQIFIDIMNDLDKAEAEKVEKGKKSAPASTVKTGEKKKGPPPKSMDDVYKVLDAINMKLGNIDKSSSNISVYINEVRGEGGKLKKQV